MTPLSTELHSQPNPPVKRKRGRPPKNNKPADAFPTFTMQLQSSPLSSGPDAEFTSNQVVLGGEPDTFTPLMKVLPSPHRKKRRRSSNFSSPLDPSRFPQAKSSVSDSRSYITSANNGVFDARVLDNLSTVLNSSVDRVPPPEMSREGGLEPGFVLSGGNFSKDSVRKNLAYPTQDRFLVPPKDSSKSFPDESISYIRPLSPESDPAWHVEIPVDSNGDLDLFGYELVVDENGQATLIDKPGVVVSSIPGFAIETADAHQETQPFEICSDIGADQRFARKAHSLQDMNSALDAPGGDKEDIPRCENFYLNGLPGIAGIAESSELNQSLSQEFETSFTRIPNIENPRVCYEHASYGPSQLTHLSSKSAIFRELSEEPNLAIGESCAGVQVESADARIALRKVFRRK